MRHHSNPPADVAYGHQPATGWCLRAVHPRGTLAHVNVGQSWTVADSPEVSPNDQLIGNAVFYRHGRGKEAVDGLADRGTQAQITRDEVVRVMEEPSGAESSGTPAKSRRRARRPEWSHGVRRGRRHRGVRAAACLSVPAGGGGRFRPPADTPSTSSAATTLAGHSPTLRPCRTPRLEVRKIIPRIDSPGPRRSDKFWINESGGRLRRPPASWL